MRSSASCLVTCVLFLAPCFAAETNLSDQFYDAIRRDDSAAVQKLLASGADVNVKDSRGGTPLMYAASVGSEAMMRRLIDAHADVNAKNAFDVTALLMSAGSLARVQLLVDHGADVKVTSKAGHTPIELAAFHAGGLEVVKLLLAKGATLQVPPDGSGLTPVAAAAGVNDTEMVRFIVEKGGKEVLAGPGGPMALMNAAALGNTEVVKLLLAKGVDVNSVSPPETDRVKNGPIALGSFTPLILATSGGKTETVRAILDAGGNINAQEVRGMTPLMLAVATDHPNLDVIKMLVEHKADASIKSKAGETALDWAMKFRNPAVLGALHAPAPSLTSNGGAKPSGRATPDLNAAIQRSIGLLQTSGTTMFREGGCVSCHGGNIVTSATAAVRRAGLRFDESAAAETVKATRLQYAARADGLLERQDGPAVEILTLALKALADEGATPDRTTDAMAVNIAAQQLATGLWPFGGIVRPPTADSPISNAAYAIRSMRQYAPPARRAEFDERIARAARALSAAEPSTTEDAVMQLLGLKWAGADAAKLAPLARRLVATQREDGGWSQTKFLDSDAWATGTVLHALHQAGIGAADPACRKAVAFLLKTQAADGSWHVASRAPKFQPYFNGGFPYGHDQWISQWSTGWATIALAESIPATSAAARQ